jgi:hypothetical protein
MNVIATALRALNLALLVFRKAQGELKRLLAILAKELIAGHGHLRRHGEILVLVNQYAARKPLSSLTGWSPVDRYR